MTILARNAGIHEQLFHSRNQRYTIAIPDGYGGETAVPLILALHWGGVVTPFYGKSILVDNATHYETGRYLLNNLG